MSDICDPRHISAPVPNPNLTLNHNRDTKSVLNNPTLALNMTPSPGITLSLITQTVTQNSMLAGFRRHLVGKTLRNVCYCDIT